MAKRPSLSSPPLARSRFAPPVEEKPKPIRPPSRQGRRCVTIWVSEEAKEQLRQMVFEQRRREQHLGVEALNDLFAKYGKHRLADVQPEDDSAPTG